MNENTAEPLKIMTFETFRLDFKFSANTDITTGISIYPVSGVMMTSLANFNLF